MVLVIAEGFDKTTGAKKTQVNYKMQTKQHVKRMLRTAHCGAWNPNSDTFSNTNYHNSTILQTNVNKNVEAWPRAPGPPGWAPVRPDGPAISKPDEPGRVVPGTGEAPELGSRVFRRFWNRALSATSGLAGAHRGISSGPAWCRAVLGC